MKKVGTRPEDIWNDIQNLALYNPDTNIKRVKEAVAVGRDIIANANKTLRIFAKYRAMKSEEALTKCEEALIWNGSLRRSEEAQELLNEDSIYSIKKFKSLLENLGFDFEKNSSLSLIELAELINEAFELIKDEHMSTLSPQQWSVAIANELQACTNVYRTTETYTKRMCYKNELARYFLEKKEL